MSVRPQPQRTPTPTQTETQQAPVEAPSYVLTLETPPASRTPRVQFANGTVDNEHMGKKKSKSCCIFKKQRAFGESSSESESDSDGEGCHHRKCQGNAYDGKPSKPRPSSSHGH